LKSQLIVCTALILSLLASPAFGGCGKWVVRDNTDFLTDPVFDQAVASSTGSNATVNSDSTPIAKNETKEADTTVSTSSTTANKNEADAIDLAGKWRINLVNGQGAGQNAGKALDLILIQTGDRLQGYGTILEDGIDIPATATGTISEEGINLDVKMAKKDYRLDMSLVKSELEGSYELYDMETLSENGNATARRSNN
jgi:hypothetical protein